MQSAQLVQAIRLFEDHLRLFFKFGPIYLIHRFLEFLDQYQEPLVNVVFDLFFGFRSTPFEFRPSQSGRKLVGDIDKYFFMKVVRTETNVVQRISRC